MRFNVRFSNISFTNVGALLFWHTFSELRVHLSKVLRWWIWSVLPYPFWWLLVENWFYSVLEWLLHLASSDHLLGKLFSSLLLWGSVCLCLWGVFPVGSKILGPYCLFSLLISVFLFGNWVHWCWEILRNSDFCFLIYSCLDVRLCLCLSSLCFVAKWLVSCFSGVFGYSAFSLVGELDSDDAM